ncbi:MAG: aminotransferase class I/II-fold pyridoxal phosphate-dependent enzyme [Candidatus Methanoplasma sp.]|jgi:aspartate aminotransferase|nr:aminotransferase class I/II-fold pyridoxal phosphate-dependent enzyme [Candidatus Methanoplasma sp.]
MKVSHRLESIPVSGIRKMFDLAGPDSINLGLGEPDLAPPEAAIEGMAHAAKTGKNKYGPTAGTPAVRAAVAEWFSRFGDMNAGNIMMAPSGSTALLEIAQAFIDPGDEVLVPDPGFVMYDPLARLAGGTPVGYGLTEGDFQPDVEDIKARVTDKTKIIVVNSPSNPTGGVLDEAPYKALSDIAADHDVAIVSDEVYFCYVYEGRHRSFMSNLDNAIVVNSFSKMMAVTGWRLGFICADENLMPDLIKMQYHVCASVNMPSEYGILNALPCLDEYLKNSCEIFKKRRDLISARIGEIKGMSMSPPRGAFYAFPSFDLEMSSVELAGELLKDGLICTPGTAFGAGGEGHLRFSYAADETKINAGMDILESAVKRLRRS